MGCEILVEICKTKACLLSGGRQEVYCYEPVAIKMCFTALNRENCLPICY